MPCSPPPIMKSSWRKRRDIKGRQFSRESVGGGDSSLRLKDSDAIPPRKHFKSGERIGAWVVGRLCDAAHGASGQAAGTIQVTANYI